MRVSLHISGATLACLVAMLISSSLPAEELTLPQAVMTATNNNPTVAAGRLSAEAAKQSAKGSWESRV